MQSRTINLLFEAIKESLAW